MTKQSHGLPRSARNDRTTVREHYIITDEDMERLEYLYHKRGHVATCPYWVKAYQFMLSIIDSNVDFLTDPQRAWLEEILERIQR